MGSISHLPYTPQGVLQHDGSSGHNVAIRAQTKVQLRYTNTSQICHSEFTQKTLPSDQKSQEIEISIRMFGFAMRTQVNITTLMWHFWTLKAPNDQPWEMLPCSHELFPALLVFPGFTWMGYEQICHSYHSNNQGLTHLLCHILKSLHMTHHSAGKQEVLHLGEEVKRTPRLRTTPFLLKQYIILIYQATPKQSMFYHTNRKEDQGCEFTLVSHI